MTYSRTSLRRLGQLSSHLARPSSSAATTATGHNVYVSPAVTLSSIPPVPSHVDNLRAAMVSRPENLTYDILSPMPSHLLNIALSDYLPPAALPPSSIQSDGGGHALPEAYHLVHFPLQLPPSLLVPDGTDPYCLPGAPFERRMWAGGRIVWHTPLHTRGQRAVCRERIEDVSIRHYKGDEKIFVDVERRYGDDGFVDGQEAITEIRTLVFLKNQSAEEAKAGAAVTDRRPIRAPKDPSFSHTLTPTPSLLFNYSALSYNAHQIHLNPQYCREVEGHRDLLVHGPLSLTLMLAVVRSQLTITGERIKSIDYRNVAPLYVGEPLTVCVKPASGTAAGTDGKKWNVWVENKDGDLSVKGTVVVGPA
ncbi:hypothetical protein JX265_002378 [Neoarthrinium moseri]|uniref:Uncharacterized protein n=1 Tax=Neoarthrinium moseri TaxID=1658444 RepID=A0A9P9WU74_9PEZI|nr:uncharacterized protein JN550_000192 [Neoarthrinium moseri]KAI1854741.1 hypothetical protein JX266_000859 [Neoarthrinium moseri]KAI1878010.1 hypothetical protein JN550_000192 [Neoarthrinium moseri]KAI1879424.1 hypothetical protein JX265_002378 [Neoarthrinium moseri]